MHVKLESLRKLFVEELKDLYSAESQIVNALPEMIEAASSSQLKQAFRDHLEETRNHVQRIEEIFDTMEFSPRGAHCKGMAGLIEEGEELIEEKSDIDADVLDAALIAAAQRVEHYEIAVYGTVTSFARLLGYHEIADKLHKTLDEEYHADKLLSELAETTLNQEALV